VHTPRDRLVQVTQALEDSCQRSLPVTAATRPTRSFASPGSRIAVQPRGTPPVPSSSSSATSRRRRPTARSRPWADLAAQALLLAGACFLRAWQRQVLAPDGGTALPPLARSVDALLIGEPGRKPAPQTRRLRC
jgi:hypothetical protein